jgi:hypothetical protein
MSITTALLMLTLAAAPNPVVRPVADSAKACVVPEQTGTFRLIATKADGKQGGALALLLLENIDGCLEATFVTDERGPAAIDSLSFSNGTLTGRLNVTGEFAKLTAKFDGKTVAGSIVAKKAQWKLEGRKTA